MRYTLLRKAQYFDESFPEGTVSEDFTESEETIYMLEFKKKYPALFAEYAMRDNVLIKLGGKMRWIPRTGVVDSD